MLTIQSDSNSPRTFEVLVCKSNLLTDEFAVSTSVVSYLCLFSVYLGDLITPLLACSFREIASASAVYSPVTNVGGGLFISIFVFVVVVGLSASSGNVCSPHEKQCVCPLIFGSGIATTAGWTTRVDLRVFSHDFGIVLSQYLMPFFSHHIA